MTRLLSLLAYFFRLRATSAAVRQYLSKLYIALTLHELSTLKLIPHYFEMCPENAIFAKDI